MDLQSLLGTGANVTLAVGANDLRDFAHIIAQQTRTQIEQEITESKNEVYYSVDHVASIFSVDKSTLWRWSKREYLKPIKVGGLTRYRKSDVDNILNAGRE